jgi:hypothetical protein
VPSSSGSKSKLRNQKDPFRKLYWCLLLARCSLSISSALKMEAVRLFRISGELDADYVASQATRQSLS